MNLLFLVLFLVGGTLLALRSPERFLPVLLTAGEKAGVLCVGLVASYGVFMGLMQVMTDSKLTDKLSRLLKPITKKLFLAKEQDTLNALTMNLSANLLGLSGLATPFGIQAVKCSERESQKDFICNMLFVVASTSLQLLPTTAISLLSLHGAFDPYAILLPTLLTTAFSTAIGIAFTFLLIRRKRE